MLNHQTVQHLRSLRLKGMAEAFARQLEHPPSASLSFEERLALLVDYEQSCRTNRRLQRLLSKARLKQSACLEDIDFNSTRGLNRQLVSSLASSDWIRSHQNLHITGPTGTGKSWLACAFGQAACRQGFTVRYERTGRLLDELKIARGDGSYTKTLRQISNIDLLVLDDFGLKPLSQIERHDLLEIIEDRHGSASTIITSQLPISSWHEFLAEPTIADALLDRLLANSHRIELKGESLRKTRSKLTDGEHSK